VQKILWKFCLSEGIFVLETTVQVRRPLEGGGMPRMPEYLESASFLVLIWRRERTA
jgi:hypothetical protein